MKIPFTKAHGCANDFLIVAGDVSAFGDPVALARAICHRHTGVGADGLYFLQGHRVHLYNSDGSPATLSGNGTRCIAALLTFRSGAAAGAIIPIETGAGPRELLLTSRNGKLFHFAMNLGQVGVSPGPEGSFDVAIGNPQCTPSLMALGLSTVPASYSSDSLWSYEIGAKDTLFNRRLAIEASAFVIDWSNIQTSVNLPSCAQMFTANRGKAMSRGFDLQVTALITDGLKLGATVGYTDAYYPDAAFGAPAGGVTPLLNAAGDKLANVLPWTAAARVEYSRDISPLWGHARSYIRVDYRWLSAANAINPATAGYDPEVSPYQNQAYGMLNLRLGVVHEGFDVSVYVSDATQSDPLLGYAHDVIGDPMFYGTAIRPLTGGFTGYYRF